MSWAKFDDRYDDNVKVKRAWKRNRATIGLHAMAVTYCSRHETDGLVDIEWIEEKLPAAGERRKTLDALLDMRLFEVVDEHHFRVHDYLDFNPSRANQEKKRALDAERKRKGNESPLRTESRRNPNGIHADSARPVPTRPVQSKNSNGAFNESGRPHSAITQGSESA